MAQMVAEKNTGAKYEVLGRVEGVQVYVPKMPAHPEDILPESIHVRWVNAHEVERDGQMVPVARHLRNSTLADSDRKTLVQRNFFRCGNQHLGTKQTATIQWSKKTTMNGWNILLIDFWLETGKTPTTKLKFVHDQNMPLAIRAFREIPVRLEFAPYGKRPTTVPKEPVDTTI